MNISLKNVSYNYEKNNFNPTIKNLNIDISNKGFTALIGSNGSGKTTIGKLMAGILKPTKGNIFYNAENIRNMSLGSIGKNVGYIFQDPERQIFAPTVKEELTFVLKIKGFSEEEIENKAEKMLLKFRLSHLKDNFPFNLSRGEKQRLALAAVLINSPKFLILDEPTTALDIRCKEELKDILKNLLNQNIGMLVISHDYKFIDNFADRVIEISGGEIKNDHFKK